MKEYQRKAAVIAGIFLGLQVLAFLFADISTVSVLSSIAVSVLYLVNTGDIKAKEAATGTAAFIVSSFALSSFGKIFFLDAICKTAESTASAGSPSTVLDSASACQGFLEARIRALTANPVTTGISGLEFWE